MRIGFDVSQTGTTKAGCGYFADSLIRHLAELDRVNEYLLYPTFGDGYWDERGPQATVQINQPNFRRGWSHATHALAVKYWSTEPADCESQLGCPDIVHSNNFFCPLSVRKARLIYTLHDLAFLDHPEWTTETNRLKCFEGVFRASVHADWIMAVSKYTRDHFLATFPHYPADHVSVVHEASRFTRRFDLVRSQNLSRLQPDQFWLTVGTLEPRKNHRRLLEAYAQIKTQLGQTYPLVLAGGKGWLMEDLDQLIDQWGVRQDVIVLGYVEDVELQWLYQNCFAFLYPSLFEGFGLPVLEAMSLGAPVITSNTTSLPEVVGSAGLLVDPLLSEDIATAMNRLATGQINRESMRAQALERAGEFSWRSTAKQVCDLYQLIGTQTQLAMREKLGASRENPLRSSQDRKMENE